ncbi:MAG TPA: hypothetical protein ENI23_16055 [bacterium]|nr:hypothetical protein [bacterium]
MEIFKKIFIHKAVTITLSVVALATIVVNLYISSVIAPLAHNIELNTTRVEALELSEKDGKILDERFIVIEEKVSSIEKRQERIENKIDILLSR